MVKLDKIDFFVLWEIVKVGRNIAKDLGLVKNFFLAAEDPG